MATLREREEQLQARLTEVKRINAFVDRGILGRELCPTPDYWHWPVLQPDELPEDLRDQFFRFGEIRW